MTEPDNLLVNDLTFLLERCKDLSQTQRAFEAMRRSGLVSSEEMDRIKKTWKQLEADFWKSARSFVDCRGTCNQFPTDQQELIRLLKQMGCVYSGPTLEDQVCTIEVAGARFMFDVAGGHKDTKERV